MQVNRRAVQAIQERYGWKMKTILLTSVLAVALLSGCVTNPPKPSVITVEVPVPTPCRIKAPEVPSWPLQSSSVDETSVYKNSQLALAEIELRKGYEIKLEAAIKECNEK